jgi:hypothetical protein
MIARPFAAGSFFFIRHQAKIIQLKSNEMKLQVEDELILSSVKIHSTAKELEQLNNLIPQITDWNYLITTIIERGIAPLLFKQLPLLSNRSLIPNNIQSSLQYAYYRTLSRSMVLYETFKKVAIAFNSAGIQVIALKGIYLSEWLYQDIALRQFSDIDLLVKEEDGLKCLSILTEMGYKPYDSNVTEFIGSKSEIIHYPPMVLDGISIEIHLKLHRDSEKYQIQIDEFWKNAIPVIINQTPVYAFNNLDLLIHLCIHLDKHFHEGHVQFTCFNDITNLLEKVADTFNWEEFINTCRLHQCEDVVFMYIVMVHKYIHATVPEHIQAKYSYLLTEADELLFIKYLNGHVGEFSAVPVHVGNLKQLTSFSDKFRYIWDIIFPPKSFMIQKYLIDSQLLKGSKKETPHPLKGGKSSQQFIPLAGAVRGHLPWWFWYPYRWWIGVKGVIRVISGK